MPKKVYTDEMIEWVRDTYQKHSASELARLFSVRFKMNRTVPQIKSMLNNYNITTKRSRGDAMRGKLRLLNEEQAAFVKDAYKRTTIANITKELNAKYGLSITEAQIRGFTKNHGYKSGRTGRFESGQEPWNAGMKGWQAGGRSVETRFKQAPADPNYRAFNQAEIGDEVVDSYGYRKRKVAQPRTWKFCHVLLWEETYGAVPDGYIVRFLDNDKSNIKIENLHLVSRAANAILNKQEKKLEQYEPDVRKAVATVAEVRAVVAKKGKAA